MMPGLTDTPRLSTLYAMQALHPDAIVYRHPAPGALA